MNSEPPAESRQASKSRQAIYAAEAYIKYKARLNTKIDSRLHGLSQRILTELNRNNIYTVEKFEALRASSELPKLPRLGVNSVSEILDFIVPNQRKKP